MASQNANLVFCSKCCLKHPRPVGNRCKRSLNVSAPVVAADQVDSVNTSHVPVQQDNRGDLGLNLGEASGSSTSSSKPSNLDTKLDLILKKMQDLEDKNELLERKIDQQDPIVSSSRFSHSSPAKSSKSVMKSVHHRVRRVTRPEVSDSSDEEDTRFSSQASGSHVSRVSDTEVSDIQPSMDFLKHETASEATGTVQIRCPQTR